MTRCIVPAEPKLQQEGRFVPQFVRRWASYLEWFLVALLAVLAGLRTLDPEKASLELWRAALRLVRDKYFLLVAVIALLVFALKIVHSVLERWTANKGTLKTVLDNVHKTYFGDNSERAYEHRISLFRPRLNLRDLFKFKRPSRSLRLYARSGTAYSKSPRRFRIDDNNEGMNEGVAGRAWFINGKTPVVPLPEWPNGIEDPESDQTCRDYASGGFISVAQAADLRVKSRCLQATVVRKKTGERWGVLVFDSRDPDKVSSNQEQSVLVDVTVALLTHLL